TSVTLGLSLVPSYLFGIWAGSKLFGKLSEKLFMRLAIGIVLVTGTIALLASPERAVS
ncbi:MAG: hypothetical protein HOI95_12635, partial [Chromatiales bacterium]|nr:hypothetical protein [Chromatiales bacterium]